MGQNKATKETIAQPLSVAFVALGATSSSASIGVALVVAVIHKNGKLSSLSDIDSKALPLLYKDLKLIDFLKIKGSMAHTWQKYISAN
jgi:hypothetical protein